MGEEGKSRIIGLLDEAIKEVNETLPDGGKLQNTPDTVLVGQGVLDSLQIVSFIVAVEEKMSEAFDKPVSLSNEEAFDESTSPFKTVGTLIEHLESLVQS